MQVHGYFKNRKNKSFESGGEKKFLVVHRRFVLSSSR